MAIRSQVDLLRRLLLRFETKEATLCVWLGLERHSKSAKVYVSPKRRNNYERVPSDSLDAIVLRVTLDSILLVRLKTVQSVP